MVKAKGFTIVELLIVIVVIGILAAITIVAYNGISARATVASMSADLGNSSKQLKLYQVDNSAYPTGIDCGTIPAANTICLKSSSNTTYAFTQNNTTNPQTFCLTATNGVTKYFINQNGTPAIGGCSITNLMVNPNFGAGSIAGFANNSSDGSGFIALSTDRAHIGTQSLKVSAGGTASNNGVGIGLNTPTTGTYMFSAWIYIPSTSGFNYLVPLVLSGSWTYGPAITVKNQWVYVSIVAPVNAGTATWYFYDGGGPGSEATGNVFYLNQTMQTQGSNIYGYADGSSPGWIWNGTPNASTSTGPQL